MKAMLGDELELLQKEKEHLVKLYTDFGLAPGLETDSEFGERYQAIQDKCAITEKIATRVAAAGVIQEPDENQAISATNLLIRRKPLLTATLVAALEQISKPAATPAAPRRVGGKKRAREPIADGAM